MGAAHKGIIYNKIYIPLLGRPGYTLEQSGASAAARYGGDIFVALGKKLWKFLTNGKRWRGGARHSMPEV